MQYVPVIFTLTAAFSLFVKLSRDIVIPFLESVFFHSPESMIRQRFVHCCKMPQGEKNEWSALSKRGKPVALDL